MFESFRIALTAILPLTTIIFLGVYAKSKGYVSDKSLTEFNKIVFTFCLSLNLFQNVSGCDLSEAINPVAIVYAIAFIIISIIVAMFLLSKTSLPKKQQGVIAQAVFRSNFVILGLPIVESLFGADNVGATSIMIAAIVPVLNISAVLVLQYYSDAKGDIKTSIINILKNPLIIGALCGLVFLLTGIKVPKIVDECIHMVTKMTTPLALFILGGTFKFQAIKGNLKKIITADLIRLVVVPLIGLTGAIILGIRGVELATLMILFGGPVAVASYPMAVQMGLDGDLAAQLVLTSTILVLFTLFCFIVGLSSFGFLGV